MAISYLAIAKVARELVDSRSEGHLRSAVSRYYYAAFTLVNELYPKEYPMGFKFDADTLPGLSHGEAQDRVAKAAGQDIGGQMGDLYRARRDADYRPGLGSAGGWRKRAASAGQQYNNIVEALLAAQKKRRR